MWHTRLPGFEARRVPGEYEPILYDGPRFAPVEEVLPTPEKTWVISAELGRVLARLVVEGKRTRVLEFGAGSSSLVLARALQLAGGGHLTSLEQMPEWCADVWKAVAATPGVQARLVPASIRLTARRTGMYHVYDHRPQEVLQAAPYDLVLVDAPQWYFGREGSLYWAYPYLAPGALVVLDDAARVWEQKVMTRWLRTLPGLALEAYDPEFAGRGIAIFRHDGDKRQAFSVRALLQSSRDSVSKWRCRRVRARRPGANDELPAEAGAV